MPDVVIVNGEGDDAVSREEVHEIAEAHTQEAAVEDEQRDAEHDARLVQLISDAFGPLNERITKLEQPVIEPVIEPEPEPEPEPEVEPEVAEPEPTDIVAESAESESESESETKPNTGDTDKDDSNENGGGKNKDKSPRQKKGVLSTLLGGSGGVRRGNKAAKK